MNRLPLLLTLGLGLTGLLAAQGAPGPTPVERYGRLRVENRQLVSEAGKPVQLRGISTYNIAGFDWLFGPDQLKELVEDFHADVVRLAMYTDPLVQGYITNPSLPRTIDELVAATEDAGIYCIVDWHILRDKDPNQYKPEALAFFAGLAAKYKDKKHLIFEICNEPNGVDTTWNERIRPYAVDVLAAIRKSDPTRVVLVGTPTWSQDIDLAAQNPLPDQNVMYVFHFYAGSHGQALRDKVDRARQTVPVFCSEWGTTDNTGGGAPYPAETATWLKFLDDRKISSANWSFSTVREGSAALLPSYDLEGTLKESLSPSGLILYDYLRNTRP
jgi:endoglucanase